MTAEAPAPGSVWAPGPKLGGALVILASGAVLVLEILSQRLIAPYVGLTLQTSTSVIGIALAAIAVGAWLGGAAADRFPPARLLVPLLLLGGGLVFAVAPLVRFVGALVRGGDESGVLVVAAAAMFAPAALLSAVAPVVVRARLANLAETGTIVGRLSGLGTLGSIVATFGTGFVLVAWVPTTVILTCLGFLLVAAGLLVVALARIATRKQLAGLLVLVLLGLGANAAAPNPCDVETAYHCASVSKDRANPAGRILQLDTLMHSYVDLADPKDLKFAYVKAIAAAIDAFRPPGTKIRALHVGGGGLTLPRYLAATRPGSQSLVYEVDPGVLALDRSSLGRLPAGVTTRVEDARLGVADQPRGSYDLVVGDAFGGVAVPWHLTTREAVTAVSRTLVDDGLYAVNLIDHGPLAFARAELATIAQVFPQVALVAESSALRSGGNLVVLASRSRLPLAAPAGFEVVTGAALTVFVGRTRVLTDDFAPVDQLLTPYG
jgi:MFS family permease